MYMKKVIIILALFIITLFSAVFAETLKAGVSIDSVPKGFFGSWQVDAQLDKTTNYSTFKPQSRDLWNLSRVGNVISLENPFTKAHATVELKHTEGNVIVFSKTSSFDNKILNDTVTIRLNGDTFGGYNNIELQTVSLHDGHIMKTDRATYILKGKKLAGSSVLK